MEWCWKHPAYITTPVGKIQRIRNMCVSSKNQCLSRITVISGRKRRDFRLSQFRDLFTWAEKKLPNKEILQPKEKSQHISPLLRNWCPVLWVCWKSLRQHSPTQEYLGKFDHISPGFPWNCRSITLVFTTGHLGSFTLSRKCLWWTNMAGTKFIAFNRRIASNIRKKKNMVHHAPLKKSVGKIWLG